jgi:hypothetical protein
VPEHRVFAVGVRLVEGRHNVDEDVGGTCGTDGGDDNRFLVPGVPNGQVVAAGQVRDTHVGRAEGDRDHRTIIDGLPLCRSTTVTIQGATGLR